MWWTNRSVEIFVMNKSNYWITEEWHMKHCLSRWGHFFSSKLYICMIQRLIYAMTSNSCLYINKVESKNFLCELSSNCDDDILPQNFGMQYLEQEGSDRKSVYAVRISIKNWVRIDAFRISDFCSFTTGFLALSKTDS